MEGNSSSSEPKVLGIGWRNPQPTPYEDWQLLTFVTLETGLRARTLDYMWIEDGSEYDIGDAESGWYHTMCFQEWMVGVYKYLYKYQEHHFFTNADIERYFIWFFTEYQTKSAVYEAGDEFLSEMSKLYQADIEREWVQGKIGELVKLAREVQHNWLRDCTTVEQVNEVAAEILAATDYLWEAKNIVRRRTGRDE